ncbi:hypothetical protein D3C78_1572110 [compost metagenome]
MSLASILVCWTSVASAICAPGVPYAAASFPGFARASATRSATDLTGLSALTINTIPVEATRPSAAKSPGLYGSSLNRL